jgi:hypothetical protein
MCSTGMSPFTRCDIQAIKQIATSEPHQDLNEIQANASTELGNEEEARLSFATVIDPSYSLLLSS